MEEAAYLGTSLHHMKQTTVADYVAEPEWIKCCNLSFLCRDDCLDFCACYLYHLISYAVVDSIDQFLKEVPLAVYRDFAQLTFRIFVRWTHVQSVKNPFNMFYMMDS